jgi:hypothetical protein
VAQAQGRVLVIRVWTETDRSPAFRARVVSVSSDGERVELVGVTTSVESVERWLRSWLEEPAAPEE